MGGAVRGAARSHAAFRGCSSFATDRRADRESVRNPVAPRGHCRAVFVCSLPASATFPGGNEGEAGVSLWRPGRRLRMSDPETLNTARRGISRRHSQCCLTQQRAGCSATARDRRGVAGTRSKDCGCSRHRRLGIARSKGRSAGARVAQRRTAPIAAAGGQERVQAFAWWLACIVAA
jgi:hypothetical protein